MSKLNNLLLSGRRIWTLDDMSVIWGHTKRTDTIQSAKQYARSGDLTRIRAGIYALPNEKVTATEIAGKLVVPSYITGESILRKHGASFQLSSQVTSAALKSRKITVEDTVYIYHKLHDKIFYNPLGVIENEATLERAVADLIYIFGGRYRFEDLSGVDWGTLREIGEIYGKKSVVKNIMELEKLYA